MTDAQVLIVGAGPTGLVLALWLTRLGVRLRIIDKAAEPGTTSRALVVHARTLELYRQVGLADLIVARGLEFSAANLWVRARKAGRVGFGAMGQGLSPFPYMLILTQDEHERLLIDRLAELGVEVERPVELTGFEQTAGGVVAHLQTPDGADQACAASYLAGCDGAHSKVREVLGIGFPGGTYNRLFYVADVEASGPVMNEELNLALDTADFLAVFPLKGEGRARFIGTVREETIQPGRQLSWDDVSSDVISRMGVAVKHVNWFSTYRVHHRVAHRFAEGRAFLLGDAAHIHSPVGGQGMNTGIGDAVNLAWKLAAVLHGRMQRAVLDTYEPERIAFARRLVATTDRAFTVVTSGGRLARMVRVVIAPRVLPALFKLPSVRRFMFRVVSQIAIQYRGSPLSEGKAGAIAGGDRLPWLPADESGDDVPDNFAVTNSLNWQVHVYGAANPALEQFCGRCGLELHSFPWNRACQSAGFKRDAAYLVRPDGYVALVDPDANPATLERYLTAWSIVPRAAHEAGTHRPVAE